MSPTRPNQAIATHLRCGVLLLAAVVCAGCAADQQVAAEDAWQLIPVRMPEHVPYGCGAESAMAVASFYGVNTDQAADFAGSPRLGGRPILVDPVHIREYLADRGLPARLRSLSPAEIDAHLAAGHPVIIFLDTPFSALAEQFPIHCTVLCGFASPDGDWLYARPRGQYGRLQPQPTRDGDPEPYTVIVIDHLSLLPPDPGTKPADSTASRHAL